MVSCPYLELAKRHEVEYGLVLSYADFLARIPNNHGQWFWWRRANETLTAEIKRGIVDVYLQEAGRQDHVRQKEGMSALRTTKSTEHLLGD